MNPNSSSSTVTSRSRSPTPSPNPVPQATSLNFTSPPLGPSNGSEPYLIENPNLDLSRKKSGPIVTIPSPFSPQLNVPLSSNASSPLTSPKLSKPSQGPPSFQDPSYMTYLDPLSPVQEKTTPTYFPPHLMTNGSSSSSSSSTSHLPHPKTFFSLHARPYPTSLFCISSLLLLCFVPSNGTTSIFLQSMFNMVAPLALIFLKQIWVPNPKDDVLVPSSLPAYLRKFGFVSSLWYGISLFSFFTMNHAGPVTFVCTQTILPALVVVLSKRLTNHEIDFDQTLMISLLSLILGALLLSGALIYTDFHWSILLSFITAGLQSLNLVWMEKYMMEVDTDPWVFCSNIAPVATVLSIVSWLLFDRTIVDLYGVILRNSILYGIQLIATTFLLHHISAFTVSIGMLYKDAVFVLIFWQLQSLHLRWFGYLSLLGLGMAAKFLVSLKRESEYMAVHNPA